jgi:mRNA interferase RelE/StbE
LKSKKILTSGPFNKAFGKLPKDIRETTYDKLDKYINNPSHPSLRVKKIKGTKSIWEISITMNYRITFEIGKDSIFLRRIGTHDILNTP